MEAEGDYPRVLLEYVAAIVDDGTLPVESKVGKTKETRVEESYRSALGCDVESP